MGNIIIFKVFRTIKSLYFKQLGQISPTYLHLYLSKIFWCWSWRLKIVKQSARQRRGLNAPPHHRLPYHINDVGLLAPLSSSLDYGHLLNYFLETNLFFNLRQMAIWPTVIAPFPCLLATISSDRCWTASDLLINEYRESNEAVRRRSAKLNSNHPFRNPLHLFPVKCGLHSILLHSTGKSNLVLGMLLRQLCLTMICSTTMCV